MTPAAEELGARPPSHRPSARGATYLPTLDGWRALAILLVLLDHTPVLRLGRLSSDVFQYSGPLGVDLFFSISGLLICSRLLDEEQATGRLHLKGFYIRRFFRIQPAALAYLAAVLLLSLMHRLPLDLTGLMAALLLVRNYFAMNEDKLGWPTAHYWSLSIEEHFYLFLPVFLLLVRRWRAGLLLSLAALGSCWFVSNLRPGVSFAFRNSVRTDTRICFLLLPAGLAVLLRRERFRRLAAKYLHALFLVPLTLLSLPVHSRFRLYLLVLPSMLVLSTLLHPETWFAKLLESAPLRFIGRISYSLYLWQELFMTGYFALHPFCAACSSPLPAWTLTFTVAIASYYFIEKPFIRLGHRIAHPASQVALSEAEACKRTAPLK